MVGTDLKIERVRLGLRQYRVAAALGIPATTLSKIENGQKQVSLVQLIAIHTVIRRIAQAEASTANDDAAA